MSLLVLNNIVKEFSNKTLLDGVTLRVERGDKLALVGPNGSGKTTLLKIAMGLMTCDSGEIIVAKRIKIGYLSQGIQEIRTDNDTPNITALHYEKVYALEQKLREMERQMEQFNSYSNHEGYEKLMNDYSKLLVRYETMDGYNIEMKIKKVLLGLGLHPEVLNLTVDKLSGGEKMRVAMARLLLEEPDLLILDEPTNHLDIQSVEWLEDFLKKFTGGVLVVSHDRYFLDEVATRIAELDSGSLCEKNSNYSTFLDQKQRLKEFLLKEQKTLRWKVKNANQLVNDLKAKGKIKAAKSREIALNKLKNEYTSRLSEMKTKEHLLNSIGPKVSFKKIKHVSKDIAWAEDFTKNFGNVVLFSNTSFHIRGGERVGIVGANGCGKTTLINILLGKDKDYKGIARLGEWVKYSYMGQDITFRDETFTILQYLEESYDLEEAIARDHLSRFEFYGDEVNKSLMVLSGGERVRLYLACIMLEDADCLIMDEPTNHLDVPAREAVERALKEYKGTVIAITHDRFFLSHCVNKILEIQDGKITAYEGNYEHYKDCKKIQQLQFNTEIQSQAKINSPNMYTASKNKQIKKSILSEDNVLHSQMKIEKDILRLEEEVRLMESSFDENTSPIEYTKYENLLSEINNLYDLLN